MSQPTPPLAVVTFGELLLRLDSPGHERLLQTGSFRASYTGGEANAAVALAQWGIPARIISKVPEHELGTACINQFRRYGVETQYIVRGGSRLGILYVETGASQRSSRVIYDREHSAFREISGNEIDWNGVLSGAGWLHFTGTAPAVGEQARTVLRQAIAAARSRGIPISMDCSYRSALWSIAAARDVLGPLLQEVDVLFGSESDAHQFFGVPLTGHDCLRQLLQQYQLQCVAFTDRRIATDGLHHYSATLATPQEIYATRTYEIDVVDRIGAGDAFAAGVIRGLLLGHQVADLAEFAVAAAVLAHTIPGDFLLANIGEVQQVAQGVSTAQGWR